jgi:thiol-disulfide isomerase/thioredoxin
MKKIVAAMMYTALLTGANVAPHIAQADMSTFSDMRSGDMLKLNFHADAKAVSEQPYIKDDGSTGALADHQGKIVLLNFWATWCAPCRKEMPMLSDLQTELGGETFEVVTLATGRNAPPAMKRFFDDINVDNLPLHRDPKQKIARDMAVLGLPITVILNTDGLEIARLRGDADWSSDNAKEILRALINEADQ